MSARKRSSVEPVGSSESQMTYSRFLELFPDNDACLDYLKDKFYPEGSECPECDKVTKFHRIKSRAAYSCQYCRHQIYPTAGTIFHKSTTSLQMWFWAIFLMSSTRCGISAKQLEREIGVSYPTAHRMFKQIRSLLMDDETMTGEVEMDEAYYGGKLRQSDRAKFAHLEGTEKRQAAIAAGLKKKTAVFGMVQRGGNVFAQVIPGNLNDEVMPHVRKRVLPGSMIYTDEAARYQRALPQSGYQHQRVHHAAAVYVDGSVSTNQIEGFWALTKNGIRGVYHAVSAEYLQDYLNEYSFRYNRRDGRDPIFWAILNRIEKVELAAE